MSPRRQQTNLSDASQSTSTDSQIDTNSMAVQASGSPRPTTPRPETPVSTTQRPATPRPATPGPTTRSGLQEALNNAPGGVTADSLRSVDHKGQREFDTLVSGMPTANDPDDTNPHSPHPKGTKRLYSEVDALETWAESRSQSFKKSKHKKDIDRVDDCFPKTGQLSGTTTETNKSREQDDQAQDQSDTQANGHLADDSHSESHEQTPLTPSGSEETDEGST